jgi:hypothetical protein
MVLKKLPEKYAHMVACKKRSMVIMAKSRFFAGSYWVY